MRLARGSYWGWPTRIQAVQNDTEVSTRSPMGQYLVNSVEITVAAVAGTLLISTMGVLRSFRSIVMPLVRPALAALAVLEFTVIQNDYFWALVLVQSPTARGR